jgi:hypothetical protein
MTFQNFIVFKKVRAYLTMYPTQGKFSIKKLCVLSYTKKIILQILNFFKFPLFTTLRFALMSFMCSLEYKVLHSDFCVLAICIISNIYFITEYNSHFIVKKNESTIACAPKGCPHDSTYYNSKKSYSGGGLISLRSHYHGQWRTILNHFYEHAIVFNPI